MDEVTSSFIVVLAGRSQMEIKGNDPPAACRFEKATWLDLSQPPKSQVEKFNLISE
jgi:hypothetical protein